MKLHRNVPLYSATDLLNFLGCSHATALDMSVLSGAGTEPEKEADPYHEILKQKGLEHEARYLETLRAAGKSVADISGDGPIDERAELTRKAMRDGVDVIYQGVLTAPGWHGYSDFLEKTPGHSSLGSYSYDVVDTKLARTARPKHVVQLCVYAGLIESELGTPPEHVHVVLGDDTRATFRLQDFIHYSNRVRARFDSFVGGNVPETVAEPCGHCEMCRWKSRCDAEWDEAGHLRLVAGLNASQARKLRLAGIDSIEGLATLDEKRDVSRIQRGTLGKIRTQARLQQVKRATDRNQVERLEPREGRGFARIPRPNEGDLFFDIEGDPVYSRDGSLEYLFGFHYVENGRNVYKAFWARDRASEKKAFEDTLDFITARLAKYPAAYVYHYASYEQTVLRRLALEYGSSTSEEDALKRLAQTYGTRENEVDDLLRSQKFVDLYKVVREAVQTSEPKYSLKNLEVFFAQERTQEIKSGGESVVFFENWLKTGDDSLLQQIADYNEFDCISTRLCRDWLIGLRPESTEWFDPHVERTAAELEKEEERRKKDTHVVLLRANLCVNQSGEELRWRTLLGYLLEYHRREARSEWWQFFKRCKDADQLVDDIECIGSVSVDHSHPERIVKRSKIVRLTFPEQELKLKVGDKPARADTQRGAGEIVGLNEEEGWLDLLVGPSRPPLPDGVGLIPEGPMRDESMRAALLRFGTAVYEGREADYPALLGILRRDKPHLDGGHILSGGDLLADTVDAIIRMKDTHLVIQGPPGTGKTFTSANAIVKLLGQGKRVGVMSQSHKAINNLLASVEDIALEQGVAFAGIKRSSDEDQKLNGRVVADTDNNDDVFAGDHQLIGGTAWLFSCDEMEKRLDYLFIDEAGQVSLANVIAAGLAARNIVLVGDQMQLPQVTKGRHPGSSGVSGLDYLMGDWATVPEDRGIFLAKTWRLHPDLCRFISDAFYESRLEPHASTSGQLIELDGVQHDSLTPAGLRFVAVSHEDNTQKSKQEAELLASAYNALLGREWVNQKGERKAMTTEDILVVSPYNMQVNYLKSVLPARARVGTVDKFQGQEAAAVLVSMASSSGDSAPRGIDFLFSQNRLNVALSRARCLSVIYCSPALLDHVCSDLERMRLVNTVCWAKEYGRG